MSRGDHCWSTFATYFSGSLDATSTLMNNSGTYGNYVPCSNPRFFYIFQVFNSLTISSLKSLLSTCTRKGPFMVLWIPLCSSPAQWIHQYQSLLQHWFHQSWRAWWLHRCLEHPGLRHTSYIWPSGRTCHHYVQGRQGWPDWPGQLVHCRHCYWRQGYRRTSREALPIAGTFAA